MRSGITTRARPAQHAPLRALRNEIANEADDAEQNHAGEQLTRGRRRCENHIARVKVTCRYRDTFAIAGIAYQGRKFDGVYLATSREKELRLLGQGRAGLLA
jgi:hypothetical protein